MENTVDVEVTIDPATGLPALEDGMYWEVSRVTEKKKIRANLPDYLTVSLMRRVEKKGRSFSTLFLTEETYFENEVLGSRDLIDFVEVYSFSTADDYVSQGYVYLLNLDCYDYSYPFVRYWDQNEENVAKAASEVYAKFQADVRKAELEMQEVAARKLKAAEDEARMEYLTGVYPPKKLN